MKPDNYVKLENNRAFKREYLKKTHWWFNFLFLAPALILFLGLAGIIYLLKLDLLVSYYTIPFLTAFVLGTIWLKAVKKHIQKTAVETPNSYLVCASATLSSTDKFIQVIFVTNDKRHNEYYIQNIASKLQTENINPEDCLKKAIEVNDDEKNTCYFIKTFYTKDAKKINTNTSRESSFPILFINQKYIFVIKNTFLS